MALRCQNKLFVSKCVHKRISQLKGRIVSKLVGNAKSCVANIMQLLMKVMTLIFTREVSFQVGSRTDRLYCYIVCFL